MSFSDPFESKGGRQLLQYRGLGPKVSRFVASLHFLQIKLKIREWITLLCALTVYSLTSTIFVAIVYRYFVFLSLLWIIVMNFSPSIWRL